jgi:hypothetical protein
MKSTVFCTKPAEAGGMQVLSYLMLLLVLCLTYSSTPKTEVISSSEISGFPLTTWYYNQETILFK